MAARTAVTVGSLNPCTVFVFTVTFFKHRFLYLHISIDLERVEISLNSLTIIPVQNENIIFFPFFF